MAAFKDVQSMKPTHAIPVNRAGVKGVKMPIAIHRKGVNFYLVCELDIFVNLPSSRKGADMSRAIEIISTVLNREQNIISLESFCDLLAREALKRFEYSDNVIILLRTELSLNRKSTQGRESIVFYPVEISHSYERNGKAKTTITSQILTMNACPCAMETTRELLRRNFSSLPVLPESLPSITHNQRNRIRVSLTFEDDPKEDLIDIIETVEDSMGGPLLSLLKRQDEGEHVLNAHMKPMFVEDIVRHVTKNFVNKFKNLPGSIVLKISSESEESIHPHNAYAEIESTLEALRRPTE